MSGAGIAVWKRYWDLLRDELGFERACANEGFSVPDWSQGTCKLKKKKKKKSSHREKRKEPDL